ncbi:MAG: hypothetical protein PWQ82_518 [Thermosediminibacterales bacterium]|nr:hypothetical protein [Thermosediminibacterales bacterium]
MVTKSAQCRSFTYPRSNSSMVNGYYGNDNRGGRRRAVQIPLWSMVTPNMMKRMKGRIPFKFLYGQWLLYRKPYKVRAFMRSNSSMVNGYVEPEIENNARGLVQIPLWSMVTARLTSKNGMTIKFKFLYGQWLPYTNGKDEKH